MPASEKVAKCPGYPTCFKAFDSIELLGQWLCFQAVNFAHARLDRPPNKEAVAKHVLKFFNGACEPVSIPDLKEVREIKRSHREWLAREPSDIPRRLELSYGLRVTADETSVVNLNDPPVSYPADENIRFPAPSFYKDDAYAGLADKSPAQAHIVAEPFTKVGFRFEGEAPFPATLYAADGQRTPVPKYAIPNMRISFYYRVVNASLHDLIKLARTFMLQLELRDRIKLCARDGCDNIFFDTGGHDRIYCKTEECQKAVRSARTAKSREKARAAKKKSTKKRRAKK